MCRRRFRCWRYTNSSLAVALLAYLVGLASVGLGAEGVTSGGAVADLSPYLGEVPGLVVVVCQGGEEDLATVAEVVGKTPWTVVCRVTGSPSLKKVRDWAIGKGLLGDRIYVFDDPGDSLWLAGGMADAVWIAPGARHRPGAEEILRVLHPGGICVADGEAIVKPATEGVDQWRHPYHEPNNNVVSRDRLARLPGELRFQTDPVWAPMPNQTLIAGGCIFFFSGHIAFHPREEALLDTLTVLNAYNGLRLWSRPLGRGFVVHNVAKAANDQEVVFAEGPTLWMLDAATGRERRKVVVPTEAATSGDTDWKWIAQEGDRLWAAMGPPDGRVAPYRQKSRQGHWSWGVANKQYLNVTDEFGAARRLAAFEYPSMKPVWSITETEPFDARALCIEGGRLFQLAPEKYVAARDAATGKPLWRKTPETAEELFEAIGTPSKRQGWGLGWATYCCARADRGVVCIAGPSFDRVVTLRFADGKLLWTADDKSPHPFFLCDALYIVPRVGKAACRKLNRITGEVLDEFGFGKIGSCTRLTVTPHQFFYRPGGGMGKTHYVDFATQKLSDDQGITRPGCFDGVVPANGRLYWMPLACDCWQLHGTLSMAPRSAPKPLAGRSESPPWKKPATETSAAADDWPAFRANAAGTATVAAPVPRCVRKRWQTQFPHAGTTAPICAAGRVFIGGEDGVVRALDATSGNVLWQSAARSGVLYPPVYWNGRVVFGSCDGSLYCLDAADGRLLGQVEVAPEKRFVNIMGQLVSAWPLAGGVVVDDRGIAYAVAGSSAADGAIVAAVDLANGRQVYRRSHLPEDDATRVSFGARGNLLLKGQTLFVNSGAPLGVVALDARTGRFERIASKGEPGGEVFLDPNDKPAVSGPEAFVNRTVRRSPDTTFFDRVYFRVADRNVGVIAGRVFCSRDLDALDRVLHLIRTDPKTGKRLSHFVPHRDVMQVPLDSAVIWGGRTNDVRGVAIGSDGVVVLETRRVEGLSLDGQSLWNVTLPAEPKRWGAALCANGCAVTLSDGSVVYLAPED